MQCAPDREVRVRAIDKSLCSALTNTIWSAFKEILCELLRKPCKVPKVFFIERGKVSSCRYQFGLLALLNENCSIHKLYVITTPKLIRGEEKIDLAAVP